MIGRRQVAATGVATLAILASLINPSPVKAQASSLVAAYGLNEGTGTTTADVSGNNITATLSSTTWAAGHSGNALRFNGSSSFVDLGNPAALQITGSMTISAWINSTVFPGDDAAIVSRRNNQSLGFQFDTTVDTGPRTIGFKLTSSTGANMKRYGATAMQANTWYYVTGVYDAAAQTMNVYLNGVLDNGALQGTVTSSQQSSTLNVNFGRRPGLSGFAFNGLIDEVRIYNRALTQAEIQADMATPVGSAPPPPPDTTAPSAPASLVATATSTTQINLAWGPATDNVGVTGYRVERCSGASCTSFAQIATPTAANFSDTGLTANTSYSYQVRAVDAAGNLGPYSNIASATTAAAASGLAAAYGLNEGTGTTTADASGNNITGTLSATTWAVGKVGNALRFNGSSSFVDLGNPAALQITGSMTISAWINSTVFPGDDAAIVSRRNNGSLGFQLDTTVDTGPRTIGFKLTSSAGANMARYGATTMQLNTWYFVTGVYDAAAQTMNVYLNGVLDNGTLRGTVSAIQQVGTQNVNLGRRPGLAGFAFNGLIDELRIYNRALSQAEIQADMAIPVGSTPPPPSDTTPPSAPSVISAVVVSASEIDLSWTASTDNVGVTGYQIDRCLGAACTNFVQIATSAGPAFNNLGLAGSSTYRYRVRAFDAAGNVSANSSIVSATTLAVPDTTPPSAPGTLSATAASATQINLAWSAASDNVGVTGYRVERCSGASCTGFAQIATPTATNFSDTGLSGNTSYSYQVRAVDAAGNLGPYSNIASATTAAASSGLAAAYGLNEGTGTTTADVSGNNITGTLSSTTWAVGHSGNALRFNGSSSFVDLGNPAALQITGSMTISAWINSTVFPGDDAAIVSRRNNQSLGFQFDTTVDTGPRTIGFKLTSSTGANMKRYGATAMQANTWYYVTGVYNAAAQTMNVYLNGVLDNGTLQGTVTSSQQSSTLNVNFGRRPGLSGFAFNGLIDEVRVYNRALTQAEIQADMATPVGSAPPPPPDTTAPSAPASLVATATSSAQISLAWVAAVDNVGVTGYRVERCQGASCTSFAQIAAQTATSFNDAGLTAATTYNYRVRAADAAGNLGAYSNIAPATTQTPDTIAPTAPSGLTAIAASSAQINLAWTASSDDVAVTGYRVERCQGAGCATFVQIAAPTATSFSDPGLTASTSYTYRVRATDGAGNLSAYSDVASASTSGTLFPLAISSNRRYLQDQSGAPFPILGRTSWFITSLSQTDYTAFIDDTAAKGYNAIEFHVVNHDVRGNRPPFGANGTLLPFTNRLDGAVWGGSLSYASVGSEAPDFSQPNEAYWAHVDALLAYAESKGLLCFMFPAYVGSEGGAQGWMVEMTANGPSRMSAYGAFIANRYKTRGNIVWMLGGDYGAFSLPGQLDAEKGMLAGMQSVAGQASVNFSAEWGGETIYTDQTDPTLRAAGTLQGAYSFAGNVNFHARRAYSLSPVMPTFLLEEPYDEEGADGANYNPAATQPVRRFQWWGWLSGIGGYISGNGFVWPFNTGVWPNHLNTQGAQDMARLNAFVRSIAWYNLVPSGLGGMKALVTAGGSSPESSDYVAAAATPDGTLLVAYIPPAHSGSITIDMTAMSGAAQARWFNPVSAVSTLIGTGPIPNTGTATFTPPGDNGTGFSDWVLVLEKQ